MDSLYLCPHGWQFQVLHLNDPRGTGYSLRGREHLFADESFDDRMTHLKEVRCLLLGEPALLSLERLDVVIAPQAGDPRRIPALLLSGLVSQAIQNGGGRLVRAYL